MRMLIGCIFLLFAGDISAQILPPLHLTLSGSTEKEGVIHRNTDRYCLERIMPGGDTIRQLVDPDSGWMMTYAGGDQVAWAIKTGPDGLPGSQVPVGYGFAPPVLEISFTGKERKSQGMILREAIIRQEDQRAIAWLGAGHTLQQYAACSFLSGDSLAMLRATMHQAWVAEWTQLSEEGLEIWSFHLELGPELSRSQNLYLPEKVEVLDLSSMRKLMEVAQQQPKRLKAAKTLMWSF